MNEQEGEYRLSAESHEAQRRLKVTPKRPQAQ